MSAIPNILKPPASSIGVVAWLKKNLFSSWANSLLTLFALWLIYNFAIGLWGFVASANWNVITVNLRLFLIGRYTLEQAWRVQASIALLSFLIGASWRMYGGIMQQVGIAITALFAFLALLPFENNSRFYLVGIVGLLAAGFGIAHVVRARRGLIALWLISPIAISIFLYGGVGSLAIVATDLWGGLLLTLVLAMAGILLSFPLGVLLAVGRQSSYPVIKGFSILYIEIIRGVPLVTLIFSAQIILPIFLPEGVTVERVIRALVGFIVFTSAYLAETVRGGLQGVGRGQAEAARALGLNGFQILWLIVLPQALRNVIPAIVGQFISLFKDTSLVAIVGLLDLAGIANSVIAQQQFLGAQTEVLFFIAAVYFVFCFAMTS
ncbi:MAG: amino acid ABC transporter permease, partial [Chloroflexi bacterium]|nr:amino acid ABC transporter permease [Chloroflexota bacterium]